MFSPELERDVFRTGTGEYGWTRAQVPLAVDVLRQHKLGILGGELWWVQDGIPDWNGFIPQRGGARGVYCWETERRDGEPWSEFVERSAADAISAAKRWPAPGDLPPDLAGRILYNLSWVSEAEYENRRNE